MKKIIIAIILLSLAACGENNYSKRVTEFRAEPVYGGIAFMGDSNTELCEISCPECFEGDRVNRGISGATVEDMANLARDVIIKERPRRVELMIGTNDLIGGTDLYTYSRLMLRAIERLRDNVPGVQVFISSVLPMTLAPEGMIFEMNATIASIASLYPEGVYYVDRYNDFLDPDGTINEALFNNEGGHYVHLNRAGCLKMFGAGL